MMMRNGTAALMAAGLVFACAAPGFAQGSAGIAAGSYLAIDVWQHPELSREVKVRDDGKIEFPPVGEVRASGLSTSTIAQRIGDGLGAYLRETAYVTAHEVYPVTVEGFVARPGRYSPDKPPTLFEAILLAGGPLPGARLDRVIIYHHGASSEIQTANLSEAFTRGEAGPSPALNHGDAVFVRGEPVAGAGGPGGTPGAASSLGAAGGTATQGLVALQGVAGPGIYPLPEGADVYTAVALAGGPAPGADLKHTRILSRQGGQEVLYEVDLRTPTGEAPPHAFPLRDGDVIKLEAASSSGWSRVWAGTRAVLDVTGEILGAIVLYDALNN